MTGLWLTITPIYFPAARPIRRATRAHHCAVRNRGVHTGPRGRNERVQCKKRVPPDELLVGGLVLAPDGFAPPLAHCKRDTIVNSSGVDFVMVSTRAMCSTQVSLTRLLHFFNPRQIYYIVANGTDCDWLEAMNGRIKCTEESLVMPRA